MNPRHLPLLIFFILLLPRMALSQKNNERKISGTVLDSLARTPIEGCTIVLHARGTSQKIRTDEKGVYSFQTTTDTVHLLFRHSGYREKAFNLFLKKTQAPDTVLLSPTDKLLEGIVVKAKLPPVLVRGDTTEFNIDSAMFDPFDAVEDLIKRLPGLEMTAGGLRFQGKPINRILVDGETLFDENGDFSMKKIPAGMVAKIQVMDTKTLEQLFNGTPADGESKTLNIKLRTGNKTFGSADAGAGTRNQLDAGASLSWFTDAKRLALTANFLSSNKTGFFKTGGGPTSASTTAGASYANKWGPVRINGGYTFARTDNANDYSRQRTQLVTADTSFFTRTASRFASAGNSHRLNVAANVSIDSSSILDLTVAYNRSQNNSRSQSNSATAENGSLRNQSLSSSLSDGSSQNWSASAYWRKWFNRKGRSLSVTARANGGGQDMQTLTQSNNTYFKNGLPVNGDTLDRRNQTTGNSTAYGLNITYTEPLTKTLRFSVNANLDANRSTSNRQQFNVDSLTRTALPDSLFSATVFSEAQTKTLGTSLVHTTQKLYVSAGLTTVWQQTVRTLQKQVLSQNLLRYAPALTATYNISKEQNLRVNFSANTVQPTIEQLQPVPDNSNPLYVRLGNPELRTAFAQNYLVNYNYNSAATGLSASAGFAPVSNQLVNAVTYDAFRRVTTQWVNVSGTYTARANLYVSRLLRKGPRTTNLTASGGYTLGRQAYFQAGGQYMLRSENIAGSLSVSQSRQQVRAPGYGVSFSAAQSRNFTPGDLAVLNNTRLSLTPGLEGSCTLAAFVYVNGSYRLAYNKLDYHSARRGNDEYLLHSADANLRVQVLKKWYLQSALSYQYNTEVPDGAPRGQFRSNVSATASVWKSRGRIELTVFDLFATRTDLRRITGDNYIEDIQSPTLRNYATLKLQYNFSRLEKKKEK